MNAKRTKHCTKPHKFARTRTISAVPLNTLQDLMEEIKRQESKAGRPTPMLRPLSAHISMYFDRAPSRIRIAELTDLRPKLRSYLIERGFKRNSTRSYVNFLRILLRSAHQLGWREGSAELEKQWEAIRACVLTLKGGTGVVRYAIRAGKAPVDFGDDDLHHWGDEQIQLGRGFEYIRYIKTAFRKRVAQAGFGKLLPKLSPQSDARYGVPLEQFPTALRTEVLKASAWKTAAFMAGRPIKARHRAVTAWHLQKILGRLYGFLRDVLRKNVDTFAELVSKENVSAYAEWCLNERGLHATTLAVWVGMIGALGRYPLLGGKTFGWARDLIAGLPPDVDNRTKQLKAQKWVDYDVLWRAPGRILNDANRAANSRKKAVLTRNALLIKWLLVAPWRQKNLRECRIGPSSLGGNLCFEEFSPIATLAKPKWVEEALQINPHQEFWQFRFAPNETKNGREVHAIVPKQLIELLEDYLRVHRPVLVSGDDPGTLFLNDDGRPYSKVIIAIRIGRLTAQYAGRRVTPHLFRDIFALKYLEERPEDYLTLSKILWHRSIQTTLKIYGARFDESHGARRVEEWLDSRKK
jgi:integrase